MHGNSEYITKQNVSRTWLHVNNGVGTCWSLKSCCEIVDNHVRVGYRLCPKAKNNIFLHLSESQDLYRTNHARTELCYQIYPTRRPWRNSTSLATKHMKTWKRIVPNLTYNIFPNWPLTLDSIDKLSKNRITSITKTNKAILKNVPLLRLYCQIIKFIKCQLIFSSHPTCLY